MSDANHPLDEWCKLEYVVAEFDPVFKRFCELNSASLSFNNKQWPSREIRWGDRVQRLIQVYLADAAQLTLNLWICAHEDRGSERYWRQRFVYQDVNSEALRVSFPDVLDDARDELEAWARDPQSFGPAR